MLNLKSLLAVTITAALALGSVQSATAAQPDAAKPTIVLVHGAFAESSSWNGVAAQLLTQGYPVVAAANPLRGVKQDADYVADIVEHTAGPVILVGHSYGGAVISNAVHDNPKVKGHSELCRCDPEDPSSEVVLDMDSFEDARNTALDIVGPIDLGSRKTEIGRLEAAVETYRRVTGFTARSGGEFRRIRLDTDPRIGTHINVTTGRGSSVRKWAPRFPGGSITSWLRRNA